MRHRPGLRSLCCTFLCFLLGALAATGSQAGGPVAADVYAVVSLVGNRLDVVTLQSSTGTSVDRNSHQEIALRDTHFDRLVLSRTAAALERSLAGSDIRLMLTSRPETYAAATGDLGSPAEITALIEPISAELTASHAHYVVLVTPYRNEARFHLADGYIGRGKLSGLGFYLDQQLELKHVDESDRGVGFIGPYAYLRMVLIDLPSRQVIRSSRAMKTTLLSVDSKTSGYAWDVLSSAQKVKYLDDLIADAVDELVPPLVASR